MGRLFPTLAASFSTAVLASGSVSNLPDINSAHENAFSFFNSIQWGSSVHHNGLSFYLATAPEGSVFYHGGFSPDRPDSFEWLAFEVEHAAQFAASWEFKEDPNFQIGAEPTYYKETTLNTLLRHRTCHIRPSSGTLQGSSSYDTSSSQRPMDFTEDDDDDDDKHPKPGRPPPLDQLWRGYFHIYRANRPLNLLYIDGQGAAKGPLGSLDSQDLILLGHKDVGPGPPTFGEWPRAEGLCALANEWKQPDGAKIDGFIRMEAGFEIIYCDFSERGGLDQVSVQSSSFSNETGLDPHPLGSFFEWLRACAARFHGHPAGRVDIDWSMRDRLRDVFAARGGKKVGDRNVVNWQSVVDSIATRFSDRLGYITSERWSQDDLLVALGTMIDPYISYTDHRPASEQRAVDRCTQHYFNPSLPRPETWTPEDHAIAAAVERVSQSICDSLFLARRILRANRTYTRSSDAVVKEAQQVIADLTDRLRWSTWRECGRCESPDEICSIPMFPVGGSEDDYFHPSCKNITALVQNFGYWQIEVHNF